MRGILPVDAPCPRRCAARPPRGRPSLPRSRRRARRARAPTGVPVEAGPAVAHRASRPAGEAGALGPRGARHADRRRKTLAALASCARPATRRSCCGSTASSGPTARRGSQRFRARSPGYTRAATWSSSSSLPPDRRAGGRHRRAGSRFVREVVAALRAEPARGRAAGDQRGQLLPDLARLLRRRLRRRADGADPRRDRRQATRRAARLRPARRSASTGSTATDPRQRGELLGLPARHGGRRFARARSTGSGSTPTRARSSRRPSRRAASATGMVTAMSELRSCFMPIAGLGAERADPRRGERLADRPGPQRGRARSRRCATMVGAVDDFRGTYNVTDYRWFDLRDHNTSLAELPAPLRPAARRLLAEAGLRRLPRPRRTRARCNPARRGCCCTSSARAAAARRKLSVVGADAALVRRVDGRIALRASRRRTLRVRVDAALADGRVVAGDAPRQALPALGP